jgi:hypothetical protein
MPMVVTYAAETPSMMCAACHKKAFDLLAVSKAKHSKLPCTTCHIAKHKTVPKCTDCHGVPHPAGMMAKFSLQDANCPDLNNWAALPPAKQESAEEQKKK